MEKPAYKNPMFFISMMTLTVSLFICSPGSSLANEETWAKEFNELCGDTQKAIRLSKEELENLVARCDKLISIIKASDNPHKKLYLFRLEKCKNFYQYIIDAIKERRLE